MTWLDIERDRLAALKLRPGMHGAHCKKCDYIFDGYDTPAPISDVIMRCETMKCPRCGKRKHLFCLMPHKYVEMVEKMIADEEAREATRRVADKYIGRSA